MKELSQHPKDWQWVERYRPDSFDDYICTNSFRAMIDEWISGKNNSHLFFESTLPGSGKTTIAKLIANEISSSILFINASMDRGIDTIRNKVAGFASRKALDGRKKVIILDEIDYMSANSVAALKTLIEMYVGHVRFIVTCNNFARIGDEELRAAFKNRFSFFNFDKVCGTSPEDRREVAQKVLSLCCDILDENESEYEVEALVHIIKDNFSSTLSFRGVIQEIQDFARRGVTMESIAGSLTLELGDILKFVAKNDLKPVREFVHTNANRGSAIIRELERNIEKYFNLKSEGFLNVFFVLRECIDRLKNCDLPEIPLICMFLELSAEGVIHPSLMPKKR